MSTNKPSFHSVVSNIARAFQSQNENKNDKSLKGHWTRITSISFLSCSKENCKINQYQQFQPIRPMHFHFIWFLVNGIISRVSHRPLYSVFIKVDFKNRNCYKYQYFSKSELSVKISMQSLPMPTSLLVKKSHFFWKKKMGMMLHLSSAPLRKNKKKWWKFEGKMTRKVELLSTRDCEAGYAPVSSSWSSLFDIEELSQNYLQPNRYPQSHNFVIPYTLLYAASSPVWEFLKDLSYVIMYNATMASFGEQWKNSPTQLLLGVSIFFLFFPCTLYNVISEHTRKPVKSISQISLLWHPVGLLLNQACKKTCGHPPYRYQYCETLKHVTVATMQANQEKCGNLHTVAVVRTPCIMLYN